MRDLMRPLRPRTCHFSVAASLLGLAVATAIASTVPLNGSLSGSFEGFEICAPNFLSSQFTGNVSLQCTQTDSTFQCTGIAKDSDGDTNQVTLQGSNLDGNLSGSWSAVENGDTSSGSFSGSFDGSLAQVQLFGSSSECSLIEIFADLNFTPSSDDAIVVGENTDSGSGTSSSTLVTTVPRQVNRISARARAARSRAAGTPPAAASRPPRGVFT